MAFDRHIEKVQGAKRKTTGFLTDLKDFLMRGHVMDLAVAVVVGAAFNAIINSLVQNIVMPTVNIFTGKPNFDALVWTINKSEIRYGTFINAVVEFVIIGTSLFVAVRVFEKLQRKPKDEDAPASEVDLLTEIRDELRRANSDSK